MYTKTKMLVISIITIIVLSLGCTSSKDVIPEYVAKKAIIYNTVYSNGEFRVKVEKHKNYPLIKKNQSNYLSRVESIKSILDSVGALRQGRDTIICVENSFAIDPYDIYQYVVKTANDTLVIEWNRDEPLRSVPEIIKWNDYIKSFEQYGIYPLEIRKNYYHEIFRWWDQLILGMIMSYGNMPGGDIVRAMRIIIDDGHILEFDCIKYVGGIYF